jgi:hypothetical protein
VQTPLESEDAVMNEFNEITNNLRGMRAGTEMGMIMDDRGNTSSLTSYIKGHKIGLQDNAEMSR